VKKLGHSEFPGALLYNSITAHKERWSGCHLRAVARPQRGGLLNDRASSTDRWRCQGCGPARSPDGAPRSGLTSRTQQAASRPCSEEVVARRENRSHRRWGKYGAQLCTPSIDGQTSAIIRFQARCRKIQASCSSLLPGQNSTSSETNRLSNSKNMTTRRGGPTAISRSSTRRWSLTLCQFSLRLLSHDAQFVPSLLQYHLHPISLPISVAHRVDRPLRGVERSLSTPAGDAVSILASPLS
jgi:hypothetical protein